MFCFDCTVLDIQLTIHQGCDMAKANGYSARFIHIATPSPDYIVSRLEKDGKLAEDKIQEAKENAIADIEHAKNDDRFYDTVITNDDLDTAYETLEKVIYGASLKTNGVGQNNESIGEDVAMEDTLNGETSSPKETTEVAEAQPEASS